MVGYYRFLSLDCKATAGYYGRKSRKFLIVEVFMWYGITNHTCITTSKE
jgi:hypothetical protein